MEKKKRSDRLIVSGSLLLLLLAGLYMLFWPQGDFSESEKRYLNPAPSMPDLSRWQTDREVEDYLSDRVPMRRLLIGLDAGMQVWTGRRTQLAAWPVGNSILEPPVSGTPADIRKRLEQLDRLAGTERWSLMVPPTHGSQALSSMNGMMRSLYQAEDELTAALAEDEHVIPLEQAFRGKEALYYRTDHHWTLEGAYLAYACFCEKAGKKAYPLETFLRQSFSGFSGTTASRSGLIWGEKDTLDCAEPSGSVTMTVRESGETYDHLIFPEQASGWDGYAVYLNGNHGMLEIRNPAAEGGVLLVFKDSFANCLLPLLAANYQKIIAVDARYWNENFSQVLKTAESDEILFCYSLDSLLHDTMLARRIR